jgi:hypothetical protein
MSRVQHQGLTNQELARQIDNTGVKALGREDLEHVALRFIEVFRAEANVLQRHIDIQRTVTRTPHIAG